MFRGVFFIDVNYFTKWAQYGPLVLWCRAALSRIPTPMRIKIDHIALYTRAMATSPRYMSLVRKLYVVEFYLDHTY